MGVRPLEEKGKQRRTKSTNQLFQPTNSLARA